MAVKEVEQEEQEEQEVSSSASSCSGEQASIMEIPAIIVDPVEEREVRGVK